MSMRDNHSSRRETLHSTTSIEWSSDFVKGRILSSLTRDLLAADIRWSLFVAAAISYRHDTVLRPFPPMYIEEYNEKNYTRLLKVIQEVPALDVLLDNQCEGVSEDVIALVDWVLNRNRNATIQHVKKDTYGEIQQLTGQTVSVAEPDHIFQVIPSETGLAKFEAIRGDRQLMYAFHGSRVENFHSILNHGLHNHMNKNSLFGEGTYLSSELSVSMPYSPIGCSWEQSCVGNSLSCFAVCELIDDPSVKCQVRDSDGSSDRRRSRIADSMGGEVPEKYYIVRNNEMIRLKYILVYVHQRLHKEKTSPSRQWRIFRWMGRHKFIVFILFYVILLVAIGLAKSKTFRNLLLKVLR